jgi:hypothetical protein
LERSPNYSIRQIPMAVFAIAGHLQLLRRPLIVWHVSTMSQTIK